MAFRLQTLLDLKIRAEEAAEEALTTAMAARVRAEEQQERLDADVTQARGRLADTRRRFAEPADRVADQLARERFRQRLEDELRAKAEIARGHRTSALLAARALEDQARASHLETRREREALEKHKEKEEERARRLGDRRAEDAASDLALAAYVRKPR